MQISVIIPTYNEEGRIGPLVHALKKYGGSQLAEVIVADAPSHDQTALRAVEAGARVVVSERPGRASQLNAGARVAIGEVLYFVHADAGIHPDYVGHITQALAQGYSAGCYRYRFDSPRLLLRLLTFFQRFDRIWARGGDQTLFVRKEAFERLGGYCEKHRIMEDYDIIIRLRKLYRFRIFPDYITVSARKYEHNAWWRVSYANAVVMRMYFHGASQQAMIDKYTSIIKTERYGIEVLEK